jgi:hypothetical protein
MFVFFYQFYIIITEDNTIFICRLISKQKPLALNKYIILESSRELANGLLPIWKGKLKVWSYSAVRFGTLLILLPINDIADNTQILSLMKLN